MGGCCSAQGTAKGTSPAPGAPPPRDKAKTTLTPADAKPPAKNEAKKVPAEPTAAKPAAEAVPPPAKVKEEVKKEEQSKPATPEPAPAPKTTPPATPPPAPHTAAAPAGPPPATAADAANSHQASTTTPTATPEAREEEPPQLRAEESATAHPGNSPLSTLETKAFGSVEEPEGTSPAMPSETEAAAVEDAVPLLPPPTTNTPTPTNVTPERVPPPHSSHNHQHEEAEDGTRGPSTARIEEVPPTPSHESDVASGKALAADDARVLQRVPPPPPPPQASPASPQEDENAEDAEEAAMPPNPLADILRRQQEEKQRYPTALTTDAADDAPLEISMEEEKHVPAAAKYAAEEPPADEAEEEQEEDEMRPLADAGATIAPSPPQQGVLYKILLSSEWAELRESGHYNGNADERAAKSIGFETAEQAAETAAQLQRGDHHTSPLVLLCCTMAALSKPAPLHWEAVGHTGQRAPRLHRALSRATDVLWYAACADGEEVVQRLKKEMAGTGSDDASSEAVDEEQDEVIVGQESKDVDDAPEKLAFVGGEEDDGEGGVNKPISFTDTSEIEREQQAGNGKDGSTPRMSPPAEEKEGDQDSFDFGGKSEDGKEEEEVANEDDEDDKPQAVVTNALPAVALAPTAAAPVEARPAAPHAVSAMQAAEAAPVSPREGGAAVAPPRRMPPPLPSPPAEAADDGAAPAAAGSSDGGATPPPSRPAPQTILSPPPV